MLHRDEFELLFEEFLKTYPKSSDGLEHARLYEKMRENGKYNFEQIKDKKQAGEDITTDVILKLLPYEDTENNKKIGAWVSNVAPVFATDARKKYHKYYDVEDWPKVAELIFWFVKENFENPDRLEENCLIFAKSPYSKGFQSGTLSPILNALRPERFLLINSKSVKTINYFMGSNVSQNIEKYPETNEKGFRLLAEVKNIIENKIEGMRTSDVFDMFCHWLKAIKKHPLQQPKYWKIAPGENAWKWEECYEGGYIAIGWDELGDVSKLSSEEFKSLADKLAEDIPKYTKAGMYQVWRFSRISEGDYVIANRGTREVIGIGRVTGPYYFVENERYGHRLPVDWFDTRIRKVNKPGWRKALNELSSEEFEEIVNTEIEEKKYIRKSVQAWFFQANPQMFDFDKFLKEGNRKIDWRITRYKDEIKPNDIVLTWVSGKENGLRAIGKINSEIFEKDGQQKVWIKIVKDFGDFVLSHDELKSDPVLRNCQIINIRRGTNFRIKQEEYSRILSILKEKKKISQDEIQELGLPSKEFTKEDLIRVIYFDYENGESVIDNVLKLLRRKKNIVLYGPPGTGKTFIAKQIAEYLTEGDKERVEMIQFHQSYSYEEFMEGYRPGLVEQNNGKAISFELKDGVFKSFCKRAENDHGNKYVFIIDEFNRGNVAKIFGELMYLLEYREKKHSIRLPYSNEKFSIPKNVYIIGTMNTADRSLAIMDFALRRRFGFFRLDPNFEVLKNFAAENEYSIDLDKLIKNIKRVNERIGDKDYYIGISYFIKEKLDNEDLKSIWINEIETYLEEYFLDEPDKIDELKWKQLWGESNASATD